MHALRRVLGLLLILALVAVACRSEATVDLAEAEPAPPSAAANETDRTDSGPTSPLPTAEPTVLAETPPDGADDPLTADDGEDPAAFLAEPPPAFVAPEGWNQPFELDPDVTEGVLPNGMSYLIRSNGRPGSQAQLRMVVRAGSINEDDGTEGVAHFLEHMMFNGTERFPGNEIVQVMEGFGSGFGPDVNAYTGYEETVYELQLPTRSTDTLQLGLDVLFQWATAATIEPDAVVDERGVVREEYRRAVEPLSGRIGAQVREVLLAGSDYVGRSPIGQAEVIETMTEVELRSFYERWYRPEQITIVAVGDFNVSDMEQRITATFVQPSPDDGFVPEPVNTAPGSLPEPVFDVLTDSEIQRTEVEVLWRLADSPVTSPSTLRADLVASMALSMVNTRLFERVQGGESALLSANAGAGDYLGSAQIVSLSADTAPTDVGAGLEELLIEIERARQFGFSPDELEREIASARSQVAQQFAESGTRQDSEVAQGLVAYALGRAVPADAADRQTIANQVLDSISVDDAQRFLFEVLATDPYVLVTSAEADEAVLPEPEALADLYDGIVGTQVAAAERTTSSITQLMERPEPAAVVDQQRIDALEATIVTYENGARLVFRQTQITENIVRLRAESPGGFFAVDGPEVPLLDRSARLVSGSGYESVDIVTLDRLLAGSIASLGTSIGRSSESISGESSTDDLETMLQLLHLQMTEPTISDLQTRQFDEQWRPLAENPAVNPPVAADLELWRLRYGDSPWFRLIPTVADLDGLDSELLLSSYRDRFADAGDFVFAVVGDFDDAELIDLGARYLGTLPDSGRREAPLDRDPGVPEENLVAVVAAGVGDQGRVRINWESPYPFTLDAVVAAEALELVVNARLRDLIREELGASYAPNAAISVLSEPKSWVDTIIEVESDPERIAEVSQVIREELDRIRAGDLDQLYLDLAVDQLTERYRFFNNNQWLSLLLFHVSYEDRPANEFRDRTAIAQGLTLANMAATAEMVFPPTRSVEIQLVPAG